MQCRTETSLGGNRRESAKIAVTPQEGLSIYSWRRIRDQKNSTNPADRRSGSPLHAWRNRRKYRQSLPQRGEGKGEGFALLENDPAPGLNRQSQELCNEGIRRRC